MKKKNTCNFEQIVDLPNSFLAFTLLQHVAALRGYEDIVRFLIQRGADVNSIGMQAFFKKKKVCKQFIYQRQTKIFKNNIFL